MLQASHQTSRNPCCQQRRSQSWTLQLHFLRTTLQQASPSAHSWTGRSRSRACPQRMQCASLHQAPAKARKLYSLSTTILCDSWPSARSALRCPICPMQQPGSFLKAGAADMTTTSRCSTQQRASAWRALACMHTSRIASACADKRTLQYSATGKGQAHCREGVCAVHRQESQIDVRDNICV